MSALHDLVERNALGLFVCGRTPVSNERADFSTVPDAYFVSWDRFSTGQAKLVHTDDGEDADEIEGCPDMVCEIVSPTSEAKDDVHLRRLYHLAGIPEYWLIDARGEEIRFDILRHRSGGYDPAPVVDDWLTSTVFGRRFCLDRVRNPSGLWQYTLHIASLDVPAS
jgi:Uma2 family endonuclease